MNADVRQVLLARAEASHSYALHLLADAGETYGIRSRPRAIGVMACEHLQIACRALDTLREKGLA